MLFEIEITTKNGYFQTIHTALIHIPTVSEWSQIDLEVGEQFQEKDIQMFISEFIY